MLLCRLVKGERIGVDALGGATWVHCIAPIIKFLAGKAGSPGVPDDQPEGRRAEAGKDETQMRILRAIVRWDIDELIEKA